MILTSSLPSNQSELALGILSLEGTLRVLSDMEDPTAMTFSPYRVTFSKKCTGYPQQVRHLMILCATEVLQFTCSNTKGMEGIIKDAKSKRTTTINSAFK